MDAQKFLKGVQFLRTNLQSSDAKLDTLQVRKCEVFLLIGLKPGITQAEVERTLNLQGPPFSRYTKDLSLSIVNGVAVGLDLLDIRPELTDTRKYCYRLNKKGQKLFQEFLQVIS